MKFFLGPLALAALCLGAASCSLRQPAPVTQSYALEVPTPPAGPAGAKSINVLPFSAAPAASDLMLLYRADELRYESDYYNRLLAPPARILTGEMRQWLSASRAGTVREPGAPLASDLVVQPRLTALYADYRDVGRPRAVIAMDIALIARDGSGARQLFNRSYRREVPMREVSPAAAVDGWSRGAAQIFATFACDLRQAAP